MFPDGIFPIGNGMLDVKEECLNNLLIPHHDINEIYDIEQTSFAWGRYSTVRRAIHKHSGLHFAVKSLERQRLGQAADKKIKNEIAVLMLCNDTDYVVKLNAVHQSRLNTALVLELACGGELETLLDDEEFLSEATALICIREVVKALQCLHERSIAHLDLKPQHILLAGKRVEDGLKLCGFGKSRVIGKDSNVLELSGTPDYMAPEVLDYEPLSLQTDIWSVGILAYELLSGSLPFAGETQLKTFLNISQRAFTFPKELFGCVSYQAICFISATLQIKPNDRMTAAECLEHIWLRDEISIDRHIFGNIGMRHLKTGIGEKIDDKEDEIRDDEMLEDVVEENDTQTFQVVSVDNSKKGNVISSSGNYNADRQDVHHHLEGSVHTKLMIENSDKNVMSTTNVTNSSSINRIAQNGHCAVYCQEMNENTAAGLKQQILHIPARHHFSDSNKENKYSATKKTDIVSTQTLSPMPATVVTAVSSIGDNTVGSSNILSDSYDDTMQTCTSPHAADITTESHFLEALSTPNVLRKAAKSENASPVKGLIKKFEN
uniref:Protein kinase domain-containing protein n=1 Tax=Glossina brevipalpis TaxID=37001 RepID=A0A1A9WQT4_9MUSC